MPPNYVPEPPVLVQMKDDKSLKSLPMWQARELIDSGRAKFASINIVYEGLVSHPALAGVEYPPDDVVVVNVRASPSEHPWW